jgi:SH3 domain protein
VRRISTLLLLSMLAFAAPARADVRYVTDEIQIVLRDSPRADGAARGVVNSGVRLTVVEGKAVDGYVRVRTSENVEGWILERHLKKEPIARERTQRLEKDLAAAQADLKKLQDEHARLMADFQRISGGEPIASREVMQQVVDLKAQLAQKDREVTGMSERYDLARASQNTLLLGGGLVAAGFVLALLLRWLWPKKRYGDL